MGQRYSRIVKMLAHEPVEADIGDRADMTGITHVIIATPTATHETLIRQAIEGSVIQLNRLHILCEKPIVKNMTALQGLYDTAERYGSNLYCVNQYAHLPEAEIFEQKDGRTTYDYFKHGPDGLHWDCFQMYALARGELFIDEKSLIWKCYINGVPIDLRNMDRAYIYMIEDFLGPKRKVWGKDIVMNATKRILAAQ